MRVHLSTNAAWYKYKGPVAEIVLALSGSIARESEWLEKRENSKKRGQNVRES